MKKYINLDIIFIILFIVACLVAIITTPTALAKNFPLVKELLPVFTAPITLIGVVITQIWQSKNLTKQLVHSEEQKKIDIFRDNKKEALLQTLKFEKNLPHFYNENYHLNDYKMNYTLFFYLERLNLPDNKKHKERYLFFEKQKNSQVAIYKSIQDRINEIDVLLYILQDFGAGDQNNYNNFTSEISKLYSLTDSMNAISQKMEDDIINVYDALCGFGSPSEEEIITEIFTSAIEELKSTQEKFKIIEDKINQARIIYTRSIKNNNISIT